MKEPKDIQPAEILPPLVRVALITAGNWKNLAAIDRLHIDARNMYPHLFRKDDDAAHLTCRVQL